ncbi:MAG: polysaccharide deacetylase family protein [Piscinibacter sp.]
MFSDLIKKLLYASGALGLYHRLRNARTLTVIMFHRVLEPGDPRWAHCDPDYTLRADLFAQCLGFFASHYNMVTAHDVLRARRGEGGLPDRALLITFDDGWRDNVDFALPAMRIRKVPGLMFVVADAVGRDAPFYQEQIVGAWRRGRLDTATLARALQGAGDTQAAATSDDLDALRHLIARVESLTPPVRAALLDTLNDRLPDGLRHMINADELRQLDEGGVAIGLHGKTHLPMTAAPDLDAELAGARADMAARLPQRDPPATMSFPHGRFDAPIAQRAREAGYELVFTSVPVVNPTAGKVGWLLGRLGFENGTVSDRQGRFRPDLLALYLFRRPGRVLA